MKRKNLTQMKIKILKKFIMKTLMIKIIKKGDKVNIMTASWKGVGILWNKRVAYIFIRP